MSSTPASPCIWQSWPVPQSLPVPACRTARARNGASLIACPQADLRLGARSPVVALEGNRTGLGTDSPAAAGALDVLAEARSAALHSGLGAGEALRMATLGGATVLGLQAQIGSIEPGKAADLTCIDLGALRDRKSTRLNSSH